MTSKIRRDIEKRYPKADTAFITRKVAYAERRRKIARMATTEPRPSLQAMADHFDVTRARLQQILAQMGIPGRRQWKKSALEPVRKNRLLKAR